MQAPAQSDNHMQAPPHIHAPVTMFCVFESVISLFLYDPIWIFLCVHFCFVFIPSSLQTLAEVLQEVTHGMAEAEDTEGAETESSGQRSSGAQLARIQAMLDTTRVC